MGKREEEFKLIDTRDRSLVAAGDDLEEIREALDAQLGELEIPDPWEGED